MALTVLPQVYYLAGQTRNVACDATDAPFSLERNRYASALGPAYQQLSNKSVGPSGTEFRLRFMIEANAGKGSDSEVAKAANELAALYRRQGRIDLADSFSLMAIYAGAKALDPETSLGEASKYIEYDPGQARFVTSPEGVDALLRFQKRSSIPTSGRWDYRTFEALAADRGRPIG